MNTLLYHDTINLGKLTLNAGLRDDQYNGLTSANGVQPRLGTSYQILKDTVFRASYARTFETPYNENLILSSGTGGGGLARTFSARSLQPVRPGNRNEFDTGLQQGVAWLLSWTRTTSGNTRTMHTISRAVQHSHHVSDLLA